MEARRFLLQHQVVRRVRESESPTASFDSFAEAKAGAEEMWPPNSAGVHRQEITDSETGEAWFRGVDRRQWVGDSPPGEAQPDSELEALQRRAQQL